MCTAEGFAVLGFFSTMYEGSNWDLTHCFTSCYKSLQQRLNLLGPERINAPNYCVRDILDGAGEVFDLI